MSQPPEMQFPGWTTAQLQYALNLSLQRPLVAPTTSTPDQHGTPPQLLQQPHMGGAPLVAATATQQVPALSPPCQMSASGLAALPQTTAPTTMQITTPMLTTTAGADSGDTIVIDSTAEEHRLSILDARLATEAGRPVTPVPATLRRSRSRESERPLDTVVPGTTNPIRGHPVPTGVGPGGPSPQQKLDSLYLLNSNSVLLGNNHLSRYPPGHSRRHSAVHIPR